MIKPDIFLARGLLFIVLIISFKVSAENTPPIKTFVIRPATCLTEKDTNCKSSFVFSWQLNYPTEVCLSERDTMLVCSTKLSYSEVRQISLAQSRQYNLIPTDFPNMKETRHIELQRLNKDVRIVNRRVWSVF